MVHKNLFPLVIKTFEGFDHWCLQFRFPRIAIVYLAKIRLVTIRESFHQRKIRLYRGSDDGVTQMYRTAQLLAEPAC